MASSTREMGPGSRRDTLDDHFGDRNWAKITQLCRTKTFIRKSKEALESRNEYVDAFIEFDAALPEPSTKAWTILCQAWEADRSQTNPFANLNTVFSDSEVRLQLAQEDADAIARGERLIVHEKISSAMMIQQGLEIEDI
ncbi:hypothetical protein H0H81_009341, partial [Sphagnurus paluster]